MLDKTENIIANNYEYVIEVFATSDQAKKYVAELADKLNGAEK